jgi:hypothetical protein
VELASVLLLAGLVGAYHLGRAVTKEQVRQSMETAKGRRRVATP